MSLLTNNQVQANIITHQQNLKRAINQCISQLTSTVAEYSKFAAMLHEEAGLDEIVDNQDSNRNLGLIGRKADALAALSTELNAIKALKGANNTETGTNMAAHKTAISYDHAAYKVQFEEE